ncbi:MAG: lamin tail domain-containing protein [bacterium]|nr:lamin tail domain-containing protein [bacterium]
MRLIVRIVFSLFLLMVVFVAQLAAITINEVLFNEPSGNTSLEWIELYNPSGQAESLAGLALVIDGVRVEMNLSYDLAPDDYQIICRRLLASGPTPGFETVWGDSSGYWGDSPEEQALLTPVELSFSLLNPSGSVALVNSADDTLSKFHWDNTGVDGSSWERVSAEADSIAQSADFTGSTPGFINSLTSLPRDLALERVAVSASSGQSQVTVELISRSFAPFQYGALFLSELGGDTVAFIGLEQFLPGERRAVELTYDATGEYLDLVVSLTEDYRSRNNRIEFIGCGTDFPGLILNELLANPTDGQTSEWVELFNRSGSSIELNDWSLGDPGRQTAVTFSSRTVGPGEYAVVAEDSTEFLRFNSRPGILLQPSSWVTLKNETDTVLLFGLYNIEADRLVYDSTFDYNVTLSRDESTSWPSRWGYSELKGGTPGRLNQTVQGVSGQTASIFVTPNPFSPDGDGFEDQTVITLHPLPNSGYKLRLYDRQGRIVHDFVQAGLSADTEIIWDGRTDSGSRLPIGIYILYFEQDGLGSEKTTLVVAR